jgi:two-component system NtrC family response regulator
MDLGLPPDPAGVAEGFQALAEALAANPHVKVVVVTGRLEKEHALRAIAQGAYDYFCKPIDIQDLKVVLGRALRVHELEEENRRLRSSSLDEAFQGMLGTSQPMQDAFAKIRKVAGTDASVLLTGESGTGKELAARAIHALSDRGKGPFVAINCGAIPETLLESELFGHEKGAFTGAHIQRKGRIEMAESGTLFLDEIGDLSPPLQVKLLRYLQEQTIERVGGREQIAVDARVIAATHRDLVQALREGQFREDLYYRLGVVVIALPPLRERDGDILLLATALLQRYVSEFRKRISGFSQQAVRALEAHNWPGNVRELENRVKRAVIMADGPKLAPHDLELEPKHGRFEGAGLREAREALEREMIERAVAKTHGNLTQAASELGISRPTLYDLMEKLGMGRK